MNSESRILIICALVYGSSFFLIVEPSVITTIICLKFNALKTVLEYLLQPGISITQKICMKYVLVFKQRHSVNKPHQNPLL